MGRYAVRAMLGLAVAAALLASSPGRADELTDLNRRIGEFNAPNAGTEFIVPVRELRDTNLDDIADTIRIRFDVYPWNNTTRLYATTAQTFAINQESWLAQCTPADLAGPQPGEKLIRIGTRLVLVGGYSLRCSNTVEVFEHHRTFVYGADAGSDSGASWRYQADGEPRSAAARDSNNDGSADQVLVEMRVPFASVGFNSRIVVLNAATGAVLSIYGYPSER